MPDRIVSSTIERRGWLSVRSMIVQLHEGPTIERDMVDHPSGAAVLAYDPERRVAMLVSEMRPPVLAAGTPRLLEAIAGALDEDDPESCVRREAIEEGGITLHELEHVATVWMTPATSTERVSLYLASYRAADRVAEGGGLDEEQEYLRVREVALDRLWAMVELGRLEDAKTLMLVQALRLRRPALFA